MREKSLLMVAILIIISVFILSGCKNENSIIDTSSTKSISFWFRQHKKIVTKKNDIELIKSEINKIAVSEYEPSSSERHRDDATGILEFSDNKAMIIMIYDNMIKIKSKYYKISSTDYKNIGLLYKSLNYNETEELLTGC